jgi:hypothetical protein
MEIDRTRLENEEVWIAKYRAALEVPSIQQSRLMKVRVALQSARNIFISHVDGILDHWTPARWQRPAPSSGLTLAPEPPAFTRSLSRTESTGKRPSGKTTVTAGRSTPRKSRNRYRAG